MTTPAVSAAPKSRRPAIYTRLRVEIRPYQRIAASLAAAAIAPVVPRRLDPALTAAVARTHLAIAPQRRRMVAGRMKRHLPPEDERDLDEAASVYWLQRVETRWGQARGISLTGWRPHVELTGTEHLAAARAAGRGTILWRVSSHSAIPLNQALASHGAAPVHLSRMNHLLIPRDNRVWRAVAPRVAPILRKGEEQPLMERVEFTERTVTSAMRRLLAALADNEVITIVGDLGVGRRLHTVKVNNEDVQLANGGAKLATTSGAALLPVTVTRTGPLRYRVDLLPPLTAPEGASGNDAVTSLIEQFAEVLAAFVSRDPAQWPKWRATTS